MATVQKTRGKDKTTYRKDKEEDIATGASATGRCHDGL